jgi:hypothetical protein
MTGYSKESKRLAQEVAQRASSNLEKSGKFVTRSATTGRFVVSSKATRGQAARSKRKDA